MPPSGRLFDPGAYDDSSPAGQPEPEHRIEPGWTPVQVVPDVSGLDRVFDYVVDPKRAAAIQPGSLVRVELNGRNIAGWITAIGRPARAGQPAERVLRPVARVSSVGPSADLIELARWAAQRWSGRLASILRTASPPRMVASLPAPASPPIPPGSPSSPPPTVVRMGPNDDVVDWLGEIGAGGDTIVVVPGLARAGRLAGRLRAQGVTTRVHPRDWAGAAGRGGMVFGPRSAVWARVPALAAIVVLDEHDEALQEERNPTWHGRDVAIERAARAGVPCYLVSPIPSLSALTVAGDRVARPSRRAERESWPVVDVVDRRRDEPGRGGLFSARVAQLVREPGTVVAVLNRKGRAVMLACDLCRELVRTGDGERLMVEQDGRLLEPTTGEERPVVCAHCGSTRLKRLRLGVTRAAEELAALAGEPVTEISASGPASGPGPPAGRVTVGTEAALHRLPSADSVVFLDFDQELLAPRYRSAEQALALLVRAARLVGPRSGGGRIVIQTRVPDHRVVRAAVRADPDLVATAESSLRRALGFPPFGALAELSGPGAARFAAALSDRAGIAVFGPREEKFLVRADDPDALAKALSATERPTERIRVAVDPPRA